MSDQKCYLNHCHFQITWWGWTPSRTSWCNVIIRHVVFSHWYFVFSGKFILNLQHQPYLLSSCGDYRRVWCEALFSKPSTLAQTFAPHQWNQLVDRVSRGLDLHSFRDEFRDVPWRRSVSSFSHWSPPWQWASLLKSPTLCMLKLFYTRHLHLTGFGPCAPAAPIPPLGEWTSYSFPIFREWVAPALMRKHACLPIYVWYWQRYTLG